MKIIAMYLPQFHNVPENNLWWGEGFTDWVSAKKAQRYFENHYQPHIPLNNYYYDLLEKDAMEWQAGLMKKYGVDGACMYHYWFESGKKILERPAENLLKWKDIDMPFCFSWANETWARSWGNIKNTNAWSDIEEPKENDSKIVLLRQDYGNEKQWRHHFEYLLPFFKDDRYIRIEGKPLFLIYLTKIIDCLGEMLACFRRWIQEEGFSDIYIIGSNCRGNEGSIIDAELYSEPAHGMRSLTLGTFEEDVRRVEYKAVWDRILEEPPVHNIYYGGFVSYDDSPRRGTKGVVVENSTPELFGEYLSKLMLKNHRQGNEFVFINAWNEWGEGMHLEPDSKYGYGYLEQISKAKDTYLQADLNSTVIRDSDANILYEKFELYLNDLDIWLTLRENNISLAPTLLDKNIKEVAIYGFGIMGRHLKAEIDNSQVTCKYIIDKQGKKICTDLPVYKPNDNLPSVDAVIVASYYYINDIVLNKNYSLISLGSLIHQTYDLMEDIHRNEKSICDNGNI